MSVGSRVTFTARRHLSSPAFLVLSYSGSFPDSFLWILGTTGDIPETASEGSPGPGDSSETSVSPAASLK